MRRMRQFRLLPCLALLAVYKSKAHEIDLPFGDINIVVVTDVHSWVNGHGRHEPHYNANYGNVLSFYEQLLLVAEEQEQDLFFVMNGDFVDGTGLSSVPPDHLTPIIKRMPFSAVNMGNHELYTNETLEFMSDSGFIDHWNGNYLTSNVKWRDSDKPIGSLYTYLYGRFQSSKILTFGFLFNFDENCESTVVQTVEDTVQEEWFIDAVNSTDYDAILVLAHMGYDDPLVTVIRQAIRDIVGPDMPIQFVNGHTHIRAFQVEDATCTTYEAGRFLDTVGYVSFPIFATVREYNSNNGTNITADLFKHKFLDANVDVLRNALDVDDLTTPAGDSLKVLINSTMDSLGLNKVIGFTPKSYYLEENVTHDDSLWNLYMRHVIVDIFTGHNDSMIFIQSTGSLRYSLLEGDITLNDMIAVNVFNDTLYQVASNVKGSDVVTIRQELNNDRSNYTSLLPNYAFSTFDILSDRRYDLYTVSYDIPSISHAIKSVIRHDVTPIAQVDSHNVTVNTRDLWRKYITTELPASAFKTGGSVNWIISLLISLSILITCYVAISRHIKKMAASRVDMRELLDSPESRRNYDATKDDDEEEK